MALLPVTKLFISEQFTLPHLQLLIPNPKSDPIKYLL